VKIRQCFANLTEFTRTYEGKISLVGMLLRTDEQLEVGDELEIELVLGEDQILLSARGEVLGSFSSTDQPQVAGWVPLRLYNLPPESARVVVQMEQRLVSDGGRAFDLDLAIHSPERALEAPRPSHPKVDVYQLLDPSRTGLPGQGISTGSARRSKPGRHARSLKVSVPRLLVVGLATIATAVLAWALVWLIISNATSSQYEGGPPGESSSAVSEQTVARWME